MKIHESHLKKRFINHIEAIVGKEGFALDDYNRLTYSRDSNFKSTIQAKFNKYENFPAIIVWPKTAEQISQLVKSAQKFQIPITPFGGGSGVCGGAISTQNGLILDLKKMTKLLRIDHDKLYAEAEPGISGLQLEKELNRKGFTLGHFPSSILCSTLGGYLAARSAGQLSSKYGKIEDMVIDIDFVDGLGRLHKATDISRSQGLDFVQAIVGSEGTLGIITKARFKVYPLPQHRKYKAYRFKNLEYGTEALKRIMQTGIKPDVLRLYDEIDTMLMFQKGSSDEKSLSHQLRTLIPKGVKSVFKSIKDASMHLAIRAHQLLEIAPIVLNSGCALIIMLEGNEKIIKRQQQIIDYICQEMGGEDLGEDLAIHWHKHRYSVSFKAPKLFTQNIFTDTMEVATTWDNLIPLYKAVTNNLSSKALVLAHISHVYPEGAAIYFTFVAPIKNYKNTIKLYDAIWDEALKTVQDNNGVISHHHGIGRLKKKLIPKEWDEAIYIYKQLKSYFDPDEILNPGVLV